MARVPNLGVGDIDPEYRGDFERLSDRFAAFSNQVPVYAHSPVGMKHIFDMSLALRETGTLSRRLIEIAIVATSHANRCAYCVAHHSPILVELGLGAETVAALDGEDSPELSEEERLVRDYALCVTERAWGIRDAMFDQLRRHFSNAQIVELTMRIALTGMFNKLNQALAIEMEEDLMAEFVASGLPASSLHEDSVPAEQSTAAISAAE